MNFGHLSRSLRLQRGFAVVAALLALTACGGEADLQQPLPESTQAALRAAVAAVPRDGSAPGASVTVDHPAYRRWSGAAGLASVPDRAALTVEHRQRAGSMLKPAVAIAVLQRVEQSRLSLGATLDRIVPDSVAAQVPLASSITLRMLLSHTSGIPDCCGDDFDAAVWADPARIWTVADYLARARAKPRTQPPGAGWSYSNTNYVLLGEVLAHNTGQHWRRVVGERVFHRAGLQNSALPPVGDVRCPGCARGYGAIDGRWVDMSEIDPSMADAAGGHAWITTPTDLTRLLRAWFDGRLFDRSATLAQMLDFTPASVPEEYLTGYGLGVMRLERNGRVYLGHFGGTAGYLGFMLQERDSGVAIAGYLNGQGNLAALLLRVLDAVDQIPLP